MRLAIVGSRHGFSNTQSDCYRWATRYIAWVLDKYQPEVVISGGARGIDSIAAGIARGLQFEVIEHLPRVKKWDGYKERDILIAEDCTHLLAIIHTQSTTAGARWTANYAKKIGKIVYIKEVDQ